MLAHADGSTPELEKREALLRSATASRCSRSRPSTVAGALTFLHRPFVQVPLLLGVAAFDVWLFGVHGLAGGLRSALYAPALLLFVLASIVVATAFHELGHASACRYGGARPGVMGVGVYLVWPAFYCDVTDAYRLNRAGRLGRISAASTSTRSSRCSPGASTSPRARRWRCWWRSSST